MKAPKAAPKAAAAKSSGTKPEPLSRRKKQQEQDTQKEDEEEQPEPEEKRKKKRKGDKSQKAEPEEPPAPAKSSKRRRKWMAIDKPYVALKCQFLSVLYNRFIMPLRTVLFWSCFWIHKYKRATEFWLVDGILISSSIARVAYPASFGTCHGTSCR